MWRCLGVDASWGPLDGGWRITSIESLLPHHQRPGEAEAEVGAPRLRGVSSKSSIDMYTATSTSVKSENRPPQSMRWPAVREVG